MYETFFGLREKPFLPIPDPDFFYPSRTHKMAFSLLKYGLAEQAGFVVLSGDVGTGKTTLVRQMLRAARPDLVLGLISHTLWPFGDLIKWILLAFDVQTTADEPTRRYQALVDFLIGQYAAGKRTVLIIDEAQNLDAGTFEELRLLSNLNVDKHFLLQIVLAGQPELKATLARPELHRFVHRIAIYYELEALGLADTIAYIRTRLATAAGSPELFDARACAAVHHYARGNPRLINVLSDLALVFAFAGGKRTVDIDTVLDAVRARQTGGFDLFRADPPGMTRAQIQGSIERTLAAHRLQVTPPVTPPVSGVETGAVTGAETAAATSTATGTATGAAARPDPSADPANTPADPPPDPPAGDDGA